MIPLSVEELLKKEKVGLALSGGGFRAAFFHLGVLARLAELGVLEHIRVISTVSGGSIVGALYYQELINTLRRNGTQKLIKEQYIAVIKIVEKKLVEGVKKNIRGKLFLHPGYEVKALFKGRERVLSDLYSEFFYGSEVEMKNLHYVEGTAPKLILNSTSLADGNHWFFTTDKMGQYNSDNLYEYSEEVKVTLSDAVAASSTVPGLLNFITFKNPDVKLVDGGVFDNLGVYALQQEKVDYMIISDASRPIFQDDVPRKRLSVLKRSFDASLVFGRKLLLSSLPKEQFTHINIENTTSQVPKKLSEYLPKLRTDLDNFHSIEIKLLSFFGYCITADNINGVLSNGTKNYDFQDIKENLEDDKESIYITSILKSGTNLSRTGGNLLISLPRKSYLSEGISEVFRKFSLGILAIIIGTIQLFNFALMQKIAKEFLKINDSRLLNVGLIIYITGYFIFIIHWMREMFGNSFKRLGDSLLYKFLHGIVLVILWVIIFSAIFFILGIAYFTYNYLKR